MEHYPEEYLSAVASRYYHYTFREIEGWVEKNNKPAGRRATFKYATFELTEDQLIMARARGSKTNGNNTQQVRGNANSGYTPVKWINVRLSDDDTAFLAESTANISELAAMACDLVVDGYSLVVKPMDGGDSIMACITGQSSTHPGVACGVSGFSDTVRDALLVVLYKFIDKLGRQLPLPDGEPVVSRSKFR
jgi:hypothetical protein